MATSIGRTFRNEPRRRFTNEYKRQVVQTLLTSPMSLSRVAREHDLDHNQLARWRREYEQGKYGTAAHATIEGLDARLGRGVDRKQITSLALSDWITTGQ